MTRLGVDDEDLHYGDGSHRWLCIDPDADNDAREQWSCRVRAHMHEHRSALTAQAARAQLIVCPYGYLFGRRLGGSTRETPTQ